MAPLVLGGCRVTAMASSKLPKIYYELRTGLCHCTSLESLEGIVEAGEICPSGSKGLSSISGPCYAAQIGAVALFDFETPSIDRAEEQFDKWDTMFCHYKPATIAIKLNRKILGDDLIPNPWEEGGPSAAIQMNPDGLNLVPYVEVWYPKPIPLKAVTGCYVVSGFAIDCSKFIPNDGDMLTAVRQAVEKLGH